MSFIGLTPETVSQEFSLFFFRQLDRTVKENDSLLEQIDNLDEDLSKMSTGKKEIEKNSFIGF